MDIDATETLEASKEELIRGATLAGRYEIIEEFGRGGMGRVYRVEDKKLDQEVALKLIKSEHSYIGPSYFALIYIGLGEYERAMDFLEKAYAPEDRHFLLAFIKVAQEFDPPVQSPGSRP